MADDEKILGIKKSELTELVRQILAEMPTSLPANGGNADTLSSKSIDYFMHWRGEIVTNPDDCVNIGIYQWFYPTTITSEPIAYGTLIVSSIEGYTYQVAISTDDGVVYNRYKTYDQEWSSWRKIADGGNADTLDGLHADDFAKSLKSVIISGSTDQLGDLILWNAVENKIPVCTIGPDAKICTAFIAYDNTKYMVNVIDVYTQEPVVETVVNVTVYYFEI